MTLWWSFMLPPWVERGEEPPTSQNDSLVVYAGVVCGKEYFTLPHRFQVESTWNKTIFFKFGGQLWTPDGLHGIQVESRWSPGGIQLNFNYFIIVIIVMLYIIHIWKGIILPRAESFVKLKILQIAECFTI